VGSRDDLDASSGSLGVAQVPVAGVGGIAPFFGRAASGDEARGPVEERESAGDGDELEIGLERLEISPVLDGRVGFDSIAGLEIVERGDERSLDTLDRCEHLGRHVAPSTQNQALAALLFLYVHVLSVPLARLGDFTRAKRPHRVPIVLTPGEVAAVLNQMRGGCSIRAC
jgi:hypothetical protein